MRMSLYLRQVSMITVHSLFCSTAFFDVRIPNRKSCVEFKSQKQDLQSITVQVSRYNFYFLHKYEKYGTVQNDILQHM